MRPLLDGVARGDRGVLPRARPAVPHRLDERGHEARARSATRSCRSSPAPSRAPGANLLALADERPRLPRALERSLVELLADRAGSKRADLGGGVRAVREYDTLRLEGEVQWGPWLLDFRRRGLEVRGAARRGIGSQDGARRCRICSWTRRCRGPSGTGGRSWCAATRSSRVPGIAEAPGWEGAVRARRRASEPGSSERGRRGPDRGGRAAGADRASSARRSRRTTRAATCCSSACSRAPCSSWPT